MKNKKLIPKTIDNFLCNIDTNTALQRKDESQSALANYADKLIIPLVRGFGSLPAIAKVHVGALAIGIAAYLTPLPILPVVAPTVTTTVPVVVASSAIAPARDNAIVQVSTALETTVGALAYKGVSFAPLAVYQGQEKVLMAYEDGLLLLKKQGFERYPSPAEVMSLEIAKLEGKLTPAEALVVDDMNNSYSEWLNIGMKREGNTLVIYENPNLKWNGKLGKYLDESKASSTRRFPLHSSAERLIAVKDLDSDLQKYLYSREWKDLPVEMKDACIFLPADNNLWPAGRGCINWYYVGRFNYGASRGVKPK